MALIIACNDCDQKLTAAATAVRRHANMLHLAIELAKADSLTEEQRNDFKEDFFATLNDAQLAWDAYRSHLAEHGLLPASTRDVA